MHVMKITYRNSASADNQHAVVPFLFLDDIVGWLLSGLSTIVSTEHGFSDLAILPDAWPSRETCLEHIALSDPSVTVQ